MDSESAATANSTDITAGALKLGAPARLVTAAAINIRHTFRAHIPLYISAAASFSILMALLSAYGRSVFPGSGIFFLEVVAEILSLWIFTLAAFDVLQLWRNGASAGLSNLLIERMSHRLLSGDRLGNSFHALAALTPMMIAFTAVKQNISAIHPFSWDKTFAQWDRAMGMGLMPWEILAPLNYPAISIILNFAYHVWFILMFGVLIWQAFSTRTSALRMQFLLAFCFVWFFGGSVLAIVFSSAGPCFYGNLFAEPNPFAPQMAYLQAIGPQWIWSLNVQHDLWHSYVTGEGPISGISAMPSMHVIVATLNALIGWKVNRRLGIALSLFAGLIVLGSVHLLWHYAVDSIAGGAIALACWLAAGVIARRWSVQ